MGEAVESDKSHSVRARAGLDPTLGLALYAGAGDDGSGALLLAGVATLREGDAKSKSLQRPRPPQCGSEEEARPGGSPQT